MSLVDDIQAYKALVDQRILNKTGTGSISLADEANCFKNLADLLSQVVSMSNIGDVMGLRNQQLFITQDNTNSLYAADQVVVGQFITNDTELASAIANGTASQQDIFNKFKRFSHGGGASPNNIPGVPIETNGWVYNTVTNAVNSTINSNSHMGFYSLDKFSSYKHNVTLSSTIADNDFIGVVIAFYEDPNDMVTNWAYGLDPASFNWPINTVSPTIPNQHTLTLIRDRNEVTPFHYTIVYDFIKSTRVNILDGSSLPGLYNSTAPWSGVSVDVEVTRVADLITVKTSQFSDAPGGKGALAFPLVLDLNSNPILSKFKGNQPYGYSVQSQNSAKFSNISFSGSANVLYDLRNNNVYVFGNSGYVIDPSRSLLTDIGIKRLLFNPVTNKQLYIQSDGTVITINNIRSAVVFTGLPVTPIEGMSIPVKDSTTAVWGAVITGGGTNHVLAYYNGTNWTVAAK